MEMRNKNKIDDRNHDNGNDDESPSTTTDFWFPFCSREKQMQ